VQAAPLLTLLGAVSFPPVEAAAAESQASETHLAEVPLASGTTLTVERSGQVALFGINRPQIQNRIDPITYRALATAYYDYDHDPSLRAAVLYGHGEHFSRGIDVDAFKTLVAAQLCSLMALANSRSFSAISAAPRIISSAASSISSDMAAPIRSTA
jgi:hypothetical protein